MREYFGLTSSPFPVHDLDCIGQVVERLWVVVDRLAKVGVDLFRESLVLLEEGAIVVHIQVVHIESAPEGLGPRPSEGHSVGVAHGYASHEPPLLHLGEGRRGGGRDGERVRLEMAAGATKKEG